MHFHHEFLTPEEARSEAIARFIRESTNGTIFHQPRFLSYHDPVKLKEKGIQDLPVAFYKGDSLVGFLSGGLREEGGEREYLSPYGSAYGGLVFRQGLTLENLRRLMKAVDGFIRKEGIDRIRMMPPMRFVYREPYYDTVMHFFLNMGFSVISADLKMIVDLERGDLEAQFHHSARKFLRQSQERGVVVRRTQDLKTFFRRASVYYRRKQIRVTHGAEEMDRIHRLFPEDLFLFEAFQGEESIGGLLLIQVTEDALYAMYVHLEEEAFRMRAINAIYAHVWHWMKSKGYRFLDLGTSGEEGELNQNLLHFKETIGGWGMLRETLIREEDR